MLSYERFFIIIFEFYLFLVFIDIFAISLSDSPILYYYDKYHFISINT